jgi:hypothetical protein
MGHTLCIVAATSWQTVRPIAMKESEVGFIITEKSGFG